MKAFRVVFLLAAILGGDANQQIESLWQYLIDGRQARTPKGLVQERIELVATDEAVMLRRICSASKARLI